MRFLPLIAALAFAGCTEESAEERTRPFPDDAPRVYFVNLKNGDTVTSPFRVVFGVSGMGVAPAGVIKANTGHHHLLIDETLGVGDAEFRRKSTDMMKEKIRSKLTVILVSHNWGVIRDLCDRAVWIEQGVTQMEGEPLPVLETYREYLIKNKMIPAQ